MCALCVYVWACVCICIYCVCMCVPCVCVCGYVCVGTCVYVWASVCVYTVYVWVHVCMCFCGHMCMCVHCVYMWVRVCMCGHVYRDQRTALWTWFSPTIFTCVWGSNSGHQACAVVSFPLSLSLALDFEFCCIDLGLSCQFSHCCDNCFHFSAL